MKEILFRTGGGLGRNINATAVVKQIRYKYPDAKIHVQCSYPDVFVGLDFVDRVFPLKAVPYFYDEHKNFEVLEAEPYLDYDYRNKKAHIVDVWCQKLGLDLPKSKNGIIVVDEQEKNVADTIWTQLKIDRPMVAFQYVGGTSFYDPNSANDPTRMKHYRDLPYDVAQEIVTALVQKGVGVIQIGLPSEKELQNAIPISKLFNNQVVPARYLFAILNKCQHGLFIDSFAQHAWAALGKKDAVVLWGGTSPVNLGYSENNNLDVGNACNNLHCGRPDTYLFDFVGNDQLWKCPFNAKCMKFKSNMVVDAITRVIEKEQKPNMTSPDSPPPAIA